MGSLVNHSVTNLINGVSQQATSVRLDNQFEEQINCFSDVTKGLTIRNGFELQNVVQADLEGRQPIEFTVDEEKFLVGLDVDSATQAVHIPLTADVTALTASVTGPEYFKDIDSSSLRVVENKDYVYILNKNKTVGTTSLKKAFYDIEIINQLSLKTDNNFDTGEYELTIQAKKSPDSPFSPIEETRTFTVAFDAEPFEVAAAINAEVALTDQTGECFAEGTKGNYRLTFEAIPENFIKPIITATESVDITGDFTTITPTPFSGGFRFDENNFILQYIVDEQALYGNFTNRYRYTRYYWDGVLIYEVKDNPSVTYDDYYKTYKDGNSTYFLGSFVGTSSAGEIVPSGGSLYSIRKEEVTTLNADYTVNITASKESTDENTDDRISDKGMVWVTGVASDQTYKVTINYHAANAPNTPLSESTSVVNVGTNVSQIKLSWVADQLKNDIDGFTDFSADRKGSNAIYIYSTSEYEYVIDSIEVDNSFDTFSLQSAVRASTGNTSGITDISSLPPVFVEGFKVRVGDENVEGANYYLKYKQDFQGWKESALDESRIFDSTTMPYIIDKAEVRRDRVINIKPTTWERVRAGDDESNPSPSFVDRNINDIFFYGSRLGFATDDSIVMSAIDKPTVFFRTTCSKVVISDRVDIDLDSSKTGYNSIKDVVTFDGRLMLNTGSVQSALLVNTSFDLTSARLSEVSSFTLGDKKPLPVEDGLYFALFNNGFTNIFSYQNAGQKTYQAVNITQHIPTYIKGTVKNMAYAANFTVCSVEEDESVLYVQNRYVENNEVLQNAWHKWTLPYNVKHFFFEDNNLYVFFSAKDSSDDTFTLVTKYDLVPQVVTESGEDAYIGWIPYLDCWTKDKTLIENFPEFVGINDKYGTPYDTVAEAYDSTEVNQKNLGAIDGPYFDESAPEYYWEIDGDTINIVWGGSPIVTVGNTTQIEFDYNDGVDVYRYIRGEDQGNGKFEVSRTVVTTETYYLDDMVYGVKFPITVTFSEITPRQQTQSGFIALNYANLLLRRMRLLLSKSGVFTVTVDFSDREDYSATYAGLPVGRALLGRNTVSDINFNFPINGRSNSVNITITSDTSTPFNLLSTEWQGQLTIKGRNI